MMWNDKDRREGRERIWWEKNETKEEKKKSKEERRGSQDKIKPKVSSLPKIKISPQTRTFV